MDTGRSPTRILIVPRPRAGVAETAGHHPRRTIFRAVRRVSPRSTQGVLFRVARELRDPGCSPASAGRALATITVAIAEVEARQRQGTRKRAR
jgi:hypothetical protein